MSDTERSLEKRIRELEGEERIENLEKQINKMKFKRRHPIVSQASSFLKGSVETYGKKFLKRRGKRKLF